MGYEPHYSYARMKFLLDTNPFKALTLSRLIK